MKKQFKIGEYAIGGIIAVTIANNTCTIEAKDYNTKETLNGYNFKFNKTQKLEIIYCLEDLTTSYYAKNIYNYIKSKF